MCDFEVSIVHVDGEYCQVQGLLQTMVFVGTSRSRISLRWRHNGRDSVSNHQPHDCFLNLLFRRRSKKTSKLRVTGLCAWNSLGTGEFPAQMASNAENVSIWWRHHDVGTWYWNIYDFVFQSYPIQADMIAFRIQILSLTSGHFPSVICCQTHPITANEMKLIPFKRFWKYHYRARPKDTRNPVLLIGLRCSLWIKFFKGLANTRPAARLLLNALEFVLMEQCRTRIRISRWVRSAHGRLCLQYWFSHRYVAILYLKLSPFQYSIKRHVVKLFKISDEQEWVLKYSNWFEFWLAVQISERFQDFKHRSCLFI